MKPFRTRNPVIIGAVSIATLAALVFLSLNTARLPLIGGGTKYTANFTDAAGLRADDQVQMAGVRIGKVESVELEGDHVKVGFRIEDGVPLGQRTRASIRIRTLLGLKYVALEPDGPGELNPDEPIPVSRTVTPFDVVPAFEGLGRTATEIDEEQLAQAFSTIAETFRDTPDEVRVALEGLSRFSQTISSRDAELASLLESARGVSEVLANRNEEVVTLLRDGDLLLRAVNERRAVIGELLRNTQELSIQLQGLVADNRGDLRPALERLQVVTDLLVTHQNNLATSVEYAAPFIRLQTNTIGTGRWFDTYIENIGEFPVDAILAESIGALIEGSLGGGVGGLGAQGGLGTAAQGGPGSAADPGGGLADLLQVPVGPLEQPAETAETVETTGGAR